MGPDVQEIIEQLKQHPRLIIADDFELCVQSIVSQTRKYHNGQASLSSRNAGYWISLRLLHRRQPGRAVTHFRTKEALNALVDAAFESASRSSVDLWFRFPLWKAPPKKNGMLDETTRLEPLPEYDSLHPRLAAFPDVLDETYETWELETKLYRKSERLQLAHARQVHAVHYAVLNHAESRYYWLREDRAQSTGLRAREDWLEELLRQSHARKNGKPFEGKAMENRACPVITSPRVSATLLKRIAPWFHADLVQNGKSPLTSLSRPGRHFASALTLVDSGNHPEAPNSAPFDLEGSLTQETCLVHRGELRELLYDTYAATRENRLSTGNFTRMPGADQPRIGATTLYIAGSDRSPRELLGEMGTGLLLESIDSIEIKPGSDSELLVRGSGWILDAQGRAESVWDIGLKIDLFDVFRRVASVGDDLAFYGACGAPSILFENIPLSE